MAGTEECLLKWRQPITGEQTEQGIPPYITVGNAIMR
jgi:hypothetical protein